MNKLVIIISILIGLFATYAFIGRSSNFDPNSWKYGTPTDRYRMARNLQETELLKGKTVSQVTELLGEPTNTNDWRLLYRINDPLGMNNLFTIRYENNIVIRAVVHD